MGSWQLGVRARGGGGGGPAAHARVWEKRARGMIARMRAWRGAMRRWGG